MSKPEEGPIGALLVYLPSPVVVFRLVYLSPPIVALSALSHF